MCLGYNYGNYLFFADIFWIYFSGYSIFYFIYIYICVFIKNGERFLVYIILIVYLYILNIVNFLFFDI